MQCDCLFIPIMLSLGMVLASVASGQAPALTRLSDGVQGRLHMNQTTLEDQKDVAVTVYNNNRALVRDRRGIKLLPGELSLRFMDVAERILPETVSLRSINDAGNLRILEQNYEYDLLSPTKLLEKYVGRDVTLINKSSDYEFFEQKATLLSVNEGPIYQVDGAIYLGHPGIVALPELPDELIARPTLVWLLENEGTDHDVEATYMTEGIGWRADYVLTMNGDETAMDIEGWVTLDNRSGATYTNAQLKLVAGEVNIVQPEARGDMRKMYAMEMAAGAPPMMDQEAFAEYHLYTLQRRTTIRQNQSKQVSLLSGADIPVKKRYEFRGSAHYYSQALEAQKDQSADVFITFENREENGLGMPLPAGIMRVYQEDRSGMLQFSGEDRIRHTPRHEELRLNLGKAFDVVGDRTQMDWVRVSGNTYESAFKVSVRNRKEVAIQVNVVEPMPGSWRVIEESHPHVKHDARTALYTLDIPADGEVELTYRVRVTY